MINEMLTRVSEYTLNKFINKPTDQEFRALHYASFRGTIEVILKLCEHGAKVNTLTKKGLNVLHVAAQGDQVAPFVYFIEKYNIKLQIEDKFGSNPLHWACYTGSEKITNFILYKYYDIIDLNNQDNEGLTALHLAVMSGIIIIYLTNLDKLNIVKKLLYKGVDLNIKDSKGRTALDMATEKKKIDIEKTIKSFSNKNIFSISKNTSANWVIFFLSHIIIEICVVLFLFPFLIDSILSQIAYMTLFVLIMITFILLNYKDPGYSQKINIKMQKEKILYAIENNLKIENYCPMCLEKTNESFKHCHHCNICIKDYDHHCFWINNCVGQNNIYYFLFFINLLMINIISSIIVGLKGILFIFIFSFFTG
jgi:ankyrin repeat protein